MRVYKLSVREKETLYNEEELVNSDLTGGMDMMSIFEGNTRFEFVDSEGLIQAIYADSYEEAVEKYKEFCGR